MILRLYWFMCGIVTGLIIASTAEAGVTRVAFIDNGAKTTLSVPLCQDGHYDFVAGKPGVGSSLHYHGSMVMMAAFEYIHKKDAVCFIVYKVYGPGPVATRIAKALDMAVESGVKYVNISLEGLNFKSYKEKAALKRAFDNKVHVFMAAGNESLNLNQECRSFPSCYYPLKNKYKHVVGAYDKYNNRAHYSNYGSIVTDWQLGDFKNDMGTSYASPRALAVHLNEHLED